MIPALIAKKVLPLLFDPLTNWLFKSFPGIDKIPFMVKYMEEENEADLAVKQLADEIDNLKDVISGMKSKIKELEKWQQVI